MPTLAIFSATWQILIIVNGQVLKNNLAILSHWLVEFQPESDQNVSDPSGWSEHHQDEHRDQERVVHLEHIQLLQKF